MEILLPILEVAIAYFLIARPLVNILTYIQNKNNHHGMDVLNSVVFNKETKRSEAQSLPASD